MRGRIHEILGRRIANAIASFIELPHLHSAKSRPFFNHTSIVTPHPLVSASKLKPSKYPTLLEKPYNSMECVGFKPEDGPIASPYSKPSSLLFCEILLLLVNNLIHSFSASKLKPTSSSSSLTIYSIGQKFQGQKSPNHTSSSKASPLLYFANLSIFTEYSTRSTATGIVLTCVRPPNLSLASKLSYKT
jgi:hypothetical protein